MGEATLRLGILGCARITRRGLIPGIAQSASGSLDAIASRSLKTARAWAEEFQVPRAYGSYEALIEDSGIDAVYIPLPNELHKQWVFAAADAGKHVLCEKPLALDSSEARAMVEHCRNRGVVLMEAFMWRHQPRTLELLEIVRDGKIGPLRLIRSSFSFPIDAGDWRLDATRGGGALFDVGCYGVSTARLFAGCEPSHVQATAHFGPTGVDLTLTAQLAFPGDILAAIDCSFEQPFRCSYELVGTQGFITVPDAYLPSKGGPKARLRINNSAPDRGASTDSDQVIEFKHVDQYAAMVDAFAASVRSGSLIPPAEDGLAQMIALSQIKAAAKV